MYLLFFIIKVLCPVLNLNTDAVGQPHTICIASHPALTSVIEKLVDVLSV